MEERVRDENKTAPAKPMMARQEDVGGVFGEAQLLLAEKRTSLASLRTGIAVFALPLSVLSVLVATSKYYDVVRVLHFLVPLLVLCGLLIILGAYLIVQSIRHIRKYDWLIRELKRRHTSIAEFIE
jgi:uncharacterized membrane protein YidH (DUF202 family)